MADYTAKFVCFANSRKLSGRCVAGKQFEGPNRGLWVRPISSVGGGQLSKTDRSYEGGAEPSLLDVVEVVLTHKANHAYQPENHHINGSFYWALRGRIDTSEALNFLDPIGSGLWGTNHGSSYHGINDRLLETAASAHGSSLRLVRVNDLQIRVFAESAAFNDDTRKVRGYFTHEGQCYALRITDPDIEAFYLAGESGMHSLGNAMLCISLGEPKDGYAYKLIAGVIRL